MIPVTKTASSASVEASTMSVSSFFPGLLAAAAAVVSDRLVSLFHLSSSSSMDFILGKTLSEHPFLAFFYVFTNEHAVVGKRATRKGI